MFTWLQVQWNHTSYLTIYPTQLCTKSVPAMVVRTAAMSYKIFFSDDHFEFISKSFLSYTCGWLRSRANIPDGGVVDVVANAGGAGGVSCLPLLPWSVPDCGGPLPPVHKYKGTTSTIPHSYVSCVSIRFHTIKDFLLPFYPFTFYDCQSYAFSSSKHCS